MHFTGSKSSPVEVQEVFLVSRSRLYQYILINISIGLSILYKGVLNFDVVLSLKIVCILENSADPN